MRNGLDKLKMGSLLTLELNLTLKVKLSQSPPKPRGILTKVFYTYGPNLVILAWTCDEFSRGQASDYRTHGRTHRQTQPTTIPEGQNWPRVKTINCFQILQPVSAKANQLPVN